MRTTTRIKRSLIQHLPILERIQLRLYHLKPYRRKFRAYYLDEGWGVGRESRSGPGSSAESTSSIRSALPGIFNDYDIASIVDAPCGDFNWMRLMDLSGRRYLGVDIVPELVQANNERYGRNGVQFSCGDILKGDIPAANLVICRDCFGHYRNRDVLRALACVKRSGSKYLLTTTYPDADNSDLETIGLFRPFNLERAPFGLPPPLRLVRENDPHKCLALWDLRTLEIED